MLNYKLLTVFAMLLISPILFVDAFAQYGTVESSIKITGNSILSSNNTQTVGFEAGDRFGISITNIDDFDGDGTPDMVIAMGGAHTYHISEGDTAMMILLMNSNGTVKDQRAITYDEQGLPDGCYDSATFDKGEIGFGEKITWLGSLTEGLDPVLMVASVDEGATNYAGNVYALSLKYNSDDTVSPVTACTRINEGVGGFNPISSDNYPTGDTYFGYPLEKAGDLNGDGVEDVYVGVDNGYGGIGATEFYILYLQQNSTTSAVTVKDHLRLANIHTNVTNNSIVDDMIFLELDGDSSTTEIAFSASGVFGGPANIVYIGSFNDDYSLAWHSTISELTGHTFADNDEFGESLLNLGDIDGDGITDIVVGSENDYSDERELGLTTGEGHGSLYVLFMNNNGTVKEYQQISNLHGNLTDGTITNDYWSNVGAFGAGMTLIDLDGDGNNELVATTMDDDSNGSNSGGFYILELNVHAPTYCYDMTIDELIASGLYPASNIFDNRDGSLGSTFKGTTGDDLMIASDNGDYMKGKKGNDCMIGGSGDDLIRGNRGDDMIYGNSGNDELHGGKGNDTINGGLGDDILRGKKGSDTLNGGLGNDSLFGGKDNDFLYGNEGDDSLNGRKGIDTCDGGIGTDTIKNCEL